MTFNPEGDPAGPADGHPGSLFITGHDRMPYGDLPDGSQVAEISIPVPVDSSILGELNYASFLQDFTDVFANWFTHLEELPRIALQYLDKSATGPRIHGAWGAHFQSDSPRDTSHVWFELNLAAPQMQGPWYIGDQDPYFVNGYMFDIPGSWADQHVAGRYLATGRFRDGGWSGMGPNLFAYVPWNNANGTPLAAGTALDEIPLIAYANSFDNDDVTTHTMDGYQHPDEWEGGAWITTSSGKSAVLFAGTKSDGDRYWYGWANPAGPDVPCVQTGTDGVFEGIVCRMRDGSACPAPDTLGCAGHNDARGWWSTRFSAWLIFYDPADLEAVARGDSEPWEPQPYGHLAFDEHLFLNPPSWESEVLGSGVQRRYRIGDVAYDRDNDLLYVLEIFADEARPAVHVWRLD